jgi:hypothetical protein
MAAEAHRTTSSPEKQKRAAGAAPFSDMEMDYLRVAQAYMLISMPTHTSAIFGVFQDMRSSKKSGFGAAARHQGI